MKMKTKWCSVGLVGSLLYGCGQKSKDADEASNNNKQVNLKNFMLSIDYENVSTNLSPANYGMQFPNNTMNESEIQNALNEMNRNIGETRGNLVTKLCKSSKKPSIVFLGYIYDLMKPFTLLGNDKVNKTPTRHHIFEMENKDNANEESNKISSVKIKVSQKDKTFFKSAVESIYRHVNDEAEKDAIPLMDEIKILQIGGNGSLVYGRTVQLFQVPLLDYKKGDEKFGDYIGTEFTYDLKTKIHKIHKIMTEYENNKPKKNDANSATTVTVQKSELNVLDKKLNYEKKGYLNGKIDDEVNVVSAISRVGDKIFTDFSEKDKSVIRINEKAKNQYVVTQGELVNDLGKIESGQCLMLQ